MDSENFATQCIASLQRQLLQPEKILPSVTSAEETYGNTKRI